MVYSTPPQTAEALRRELEQAGWQVIMAPDPATYATFARNVSACVALLAPPAAQEPQVTAALSAGFSALVPVTTAHMQLPFAAWTSTPIVLGTTEAEWRSAMSALVATLMRVTPNPPPLATPLAAPPAAPPAPDIPAAPAAAQLPYPMPSGAAPQPDYPAAAPYAAAPYAATSWAATPALPAASGQYGGLVREYPASPLRYGWFLLIALAVFGVMGSFTQPSLIGAIFWLAVGAGGALYFYYRLRNVHAWVYERGFVITRGDKTTSGRWDEIASVRHSVTQWRMYFIIPMGKTHTYIVRLNSGEEERVTSAFVNETQLGDSIQRMWAYAMIAKGKPPLP